MSSKIKYACIKTADDKVRNYYRPTNLIVKSRSNLTPIDPKNYNDFSSDHYYVYWQVCKNNCKIDSGCCSFYKCYILSLGETEEDAKNNYKMRPKRQIFPTKPMDSSGSSVTVNPLPMKTIKNLNKISQKNNNENTIQMYKKSVLLTTRQPLCSNSSLSIQSNKQCQIRLRKIDEICTSPQPSISKKAKKNEDLDEMDSNPYSGSESCSSKLSLTPKMSCRSLSLTHSSPLLWGSPSNSNLYKHPSLPSCSGTQKNYGTRNSRASTPQRSPSDSYHSSLAHSPSPSPTRKTPQLSPHLSLYHSRANSSLPRDPRGSTPQRSPSVSYHSSLAHSPSPSPTRKTPQLSSLSLYHSRANSSLPSTPRNPPPINAPPRTPGLSSRIPRPVSRNPIRRPIINSDSDDEEENIPPIRRRFNARRQVIPVLDDEDIVEENSDDELLDANFPIMDKYKNKLYQLYKKRNMLQPSHELPTHPRYSVITENDKQVVYLGPRATMEQGAWQLMKSKIKGKFGRELSALIFKNMLPNVCLDYFKTKCREIPDHGKVVLVSPTKLELYLSLYADYINQHPLYQNKSKVDKKYMLKASTKYITNSIRDARGPLTKNINN